MFNKRYIPLLVAFALMTITFAYAATQIVFNNSVKVNLGANVGVTPLQSTQFSPSCPAAGSPTYATSGTGLPTQNWNISTGGQQTQYMCQENTGTGSDAASVTITGSGGTTIAAGCPVPSLSTNNLGYVVAGGPTGGTLGAGGVAQWSITICANSNPADVGSFSFTITVN